MPVVTIRGQMGSGAPEVGKEVARLIKGDYIDRQVLEEVARRVGRPEIHVEEKEKVPGRLSKRVLSFLESALARSGGVESTNVGTLWEPLDDEKYLEALKSVIEGLALQDNVVLVGRGSQFILGDNSAVLHVLTIASPKERIKRVMAQNQVDEEEAQKRIEEYDGSRRAFIQRFFKRELEDPGFYDLVVNTEFIKYETAARIIYTCAVEKTPWFHG